MINHGQKKLCNTWMASTVGKKVQSTMDERLFHRKLWRKDTCLAYSLKYYGFIRIYCRGGIWPYTCCMYHRNMHTQLFSDKRKITVRVGTFLYLKNSANVAKIVIKWRKAQGGMSVDSIDKVYGNLRNYFAKRSTGGLSSDPNSKWWSLTLESNRKR